MTIGLARQALAELIGTFALVFAGCGAIMVDATTHALGHVGVAISFGLVIMVMIYAVGHISGAHFNPAVTFAFALTRHFPWRRVAVYWPAQLAGALAAALVLRGSLGNVAHVGATLPSGSDGQAFLWESVLTFFLMFVIMAVATDTRAVGEAAAIAIGGTVGLDAMFGGPVTGASMNPARSLGPAIAGGDYTAIWVYIAAPLLGAAVAAAVYQFLRAEARHARGRAEPEGEGRSVSHVLFVCIQNAGRSQIAQALFEAGCGRPARGTLGRQPARRPRPPRGRRGDGGGRHRPLRQGAARARHGRHAVGRPGGDDGLRR